MGGTIVCLAAVLLGVDARWPSLPDGGKQYVVQIEPEALNQLELGVVESLASHVPPYVDDIQAYQIVLGEQELPKTSPTPNVQSRVLDGVETDWILLPDGRFECRMWIHVDTLAELRQPGRVIEDWIPADVKTLSLFTIVVGTKPVVEEPVAEESVVEESVVEESVVEESVAGESVAGEPVVEESVVEESVVEESVVEESVVEESVVEESVVEESVVEESVVEESVVEESVVEESVVEESVVEESVAEEPVAEEPVAEEPAGPEPDLLQPDANSGPIYDAGQANYEEPLEADPELDPALGADVAVEWPISSAVMFLGLCASLAANLFLLWAMRDFRKHHRALLKRMGEVGDIV